MSDKLNRVHFHAIAAGGDAVGRDENGRTVFAPYGAAGETAQVAVEETSKSFARGRILHIEQAAPERIEPPCPYYLPQGIDHPAAACGGCQVQHLDYAAQLEVKRNLVRDALVRVGRFDAGMIEEILAPCVPSPLPFGYRNKGDFVVAGEGSRFEIGFFARGSHHLIDIERCPLQQETNNRILAAVRECVAAGLVEAFDPATGRGVLRRVVARTASNGEALVSAVTTRAAWPQAKDFARRVRELVPEVVGVLRREPRGKAKLLEGRDWLMETVGGLTLRVSGEGFFQVNTALTPALSGQALRLLDARAGERVIDLFCGVGLFGLAAAQSGAQVLGIEANPAAIDDARANAKRNELKTRFIAGDAARELGRLVAGEWDKLLLDPPREGARECLGEILRLAPRRIVYMSCDPATLARDLKALTAQDYRLFEAIPFDLFPQTAHVEMVVRLDRR